MKIRPPGGSGHFCGILTVLLLVDSGMMKWTHDWNPEYSPSIIAFLSDSSNVIFIKHHSGGFLKDTPLKTNISPEKLMGGR